MIKVSVIVPVFNTEKYKEKCLNSLINQTLQDIEIICVNDGSTDKSADIIKKFANKDSRFKLINQENKKQGAARNTGMKIAKGEYIGFVDSDDWVDLEYYEKLYNAAKKGKFMSISDMKIRAKVGDSVVELLRKFGCLDGMSQSNQLSLFG